MSLSDLQRRALAALCDTVVPSVERPADPDGFWARSATASGVDAAVADLVEQIPDPAIRGGLAQLLEVLAGQGLLGAPSQASREQLLRNLALASPEAAAGLNALTGMTLFVHYGAPDPATGVNPNWKTFGYPGPAAAPPQVPKAIETITPQPGQEIEADVCVVGSGSGGGVIAGTLARRGLDDAHLDAVLRRIGANDECSDLNGPHQRMKEGCDALGWSFKTIVRNADPGSYSPDTAGYVGFGDQTGSKQSGEKTWLRDAAAAGAEFLVRTRAMRILTDGGRAAGVEAVFDGSVPVTIRAPRVVVACGALESPALLARSGIGGPAVGRNLRLHPSLAILGAYTQEQQAWWGAPQSALCDEFADTGDGYGFLLEGAQYAPGLAASALPWTSGAGHKQVLENFRSGASLISLTRDRGSGHVEFDANGEAIPFYAVTDELDARNIYRSVEALARIHEAAGAHEIRGLSSRLPLWRRGDDLDAWLERATQVHLGAGGWRLFSAHQLGTCRMGTDPQQSVAGPFGELHDTPGVFIGDGSAFPTASGTNPMISIMALAHRTAEAIADAAGATAEPATATAES